MNKVVVVIVTYNRKKMLEESIKALIKQSFKEFDIIIVDNNSTDGTYIDVVKKYENNHNIKYINTGKNLGGAGGFNIGIREACKNNYDFAWVMDDDAIAEEYALESLIKKSKFLDNKFSFISSFIKWTNNTYCKMNMVSLDNETTMKNYNNINEKLLGIKTASFVGCFINMKYVKKVGLPIKEFFIYADDLEYTKRLSNEEFAYIDMDSIIIHKMKDNVTSEIYTVRDERINRYFYEFRNVTYMQIKEKKLKGAIKSIFRCLNATIKILKYAKSKKIKRIWIITKGTWCGLFFRPKIEFVD